MLLIIDSPNPRESFDASFFLNLTNKSFSEKDALKVLPGLIPIFSVLKSYKPCLILLLMRLALSSKA